MNFIFSANDNYVLPLTVCLTSILENHKSEKISVYIMQDDFKEKSRETLKNLFSKYNQSLIIIDVDDKYYDGVPSLRWSKQTYYRLLFNELLPQTIDRMLYLDCDIIVDKNIKELYESDMEDFYILAFPELLNRNARTRLGLGDGLYFQAGVLLFDLNKCRPLLNYEKSIEIIDKLGSDMIAVDQDVVNVAFDGKIKVVEEKYNNCRITNFDGSNLNRIFNHVNKKDIDTTHVFHYATGKPWNNLFSGSCEDVWYKYLLLSPYKYLYKQKFNRIKYKFLRSGIIKYLLFLYIYLTPFINNTFKIFLPKKIYFLLRNFYRKNIK